VLGAGAMNHHGEEPTTQVQNAQDEEYLSKFPRGIIDSIGDIVQFKDGSSDKI